MAGFSEGVEWRFLFGLWGRGIGFPYPAEEGRVGEWGLMRVGGVGLGVWGQKGPLGSRKWLAVVANEWRGKGQFDSTLMGGN